MTDEQGQCFRPGRRQFRISIRQPLEPSGIHSLEELMSPLVLGVEHQGRLGAVTDDDLVQPLTQVCAEQLHLLVAERWTHPPHR